MNLPRFVRLLAIAVPLNFIWEMAQAPAFTGMPAGWAAATAMCAQAAMGDGVILLMLWAVGAMTFRDSAWFAPPAWRPYTLVLVVGVVFQSAIEWVMVYQLHRWAYQPWHPRVPLLRVGALPILQAVVLTPLGFAIAARWESRLRSVTTNDRFRT